MKNIFPFVYDVVRVSGQSLVFSHVDFTVNFGPVISGEVYATAKFFPLKGILELFLPAPASYMPRHVLYVADLQCSSRQVYEEKNVTL